MRPRQRARDQQADVAGLELKRRLLHRVADIDPEAADLERVLIELIEEIGPPTGPTRGVALTFRDEYEAANANPDWLAHLLAEAVEDRPDGRRLPP
jgi:hypothetical protein